MTKHSYFRNGKPITAEEALDRNGLIRDGAVMRTHMAAMDQQTFGRRPVIVDANQPDDPMALHRPGFRIPAIDARTPVLRHVVSDAQRQICADERAAYDRRLRDAWKGPSHLANSAGDAATERQDYHEALVNAYENPESARPRGNAASAVHQQKIRDAVTGPLYDQYDANLATAYLTGK